MNCDHFMRLIVMFDLPTETNADLRRYRNFIKYLTNDGYIRIQYSIYAKLCINRESAVIAAKRLSMNAPKPGDIRYLTVTETQYLSIANVNETYSMQEKVTCINRTIMIGGMNDEDNT